MWMELVLSSFVCDMPDIFENYCYMITNSKVNKLIQILHKMEKICEGSYKVLCIEAVGAHSSIPFKIYLVHM